MILTSSKLPIHELKFCTKLRILIVTPFFPPAWSYGGPVRVTYDHACELAKRGHAITIATTDVFDAKNRFSGPTNQLITQSIGESISQSKNQKTIPMHREENQLAIIRFHNISNFFAKQNLYLPFGFSKWLKKNINNFDLIHLHDYHTALNITAIKIAKKNKIPLVLTGHGNIVPHSNRGRATIKKIFNFIWGRKILQTVNKILALSQKEKNELINFGIPEKKIAIVPNGINLEEFQNLSTTNTFRKKFNLSSSSRIILFLGRLQKIKNPSLLVQAFTLLQSKIPNLQLIFAGPDEGEQSKLEQLIQKLNLNSTVIFTGILSGLQKSMALKSADILVLPSHDEPFGLVLLEALAAGTPIAVSETVGLADEFVKAKAGEKFSLTPNSLANAINKILTDKNYSAKIVLNGQKLLREKFTTQKIAEQLEKIYFEILK